jgi:hypothetical protein
MSNDGIFNYDHPTSSHAPSEPVQPAAGGNANSGANTYASSNANSGTNANNRGANTGDDASIIEPPSEIKELRASPERQMFGDSSAREIADVLRSDTELDVQMMGNNLSPEARRAFFTEVGHIAQDLGLATTDVREFITLSREEHPGIEARFAETVKALTERYGIERRQEAYTAAYELIDRDPRVRNLLANAGLLDHPKVVLKMAEKALSMRGQGKLKAGKR